MQSKPEKAKQLRKTAIKQLRATADASEMYQNKWLTDDNWIELINGLHTNSTLTSQELNSAISLDASTKDVVNIMDGSSNRTGIYRNVLQETSRAGKKRRVKCYYLTKPGSSVCPGLWGRGGGKVTQGICASASLGKDTTTPEDEKKAAHDEAPPETRASKRQRSRKVPSSSTPERQPILRNVLSVAGPAGKRIVTEQKALPSSTPERPPDIPSVAKVPGPQEHQTPRVVSGRKRERTILDNPANPNAQLSPWTGALSKLMPRKADALVAAQSNGTKAKWTHKNDPAPDPASSNVREAAIRVEKLLQVVSDGDEVTAATILFVALRPRRMKGVLKSLEAQLQKSIDKQMADSIYDFLFLYIPKAGARRRIKMPLMQF
jgi:hypothetical protein